MKRLYALAALVAFQSLWLWHTLHLRMEPDVTDYTQGGFGLYPSPLGRIFGSAGQNVLAIEVAAAAAATVILIGRRANLHSAIVFSLTPIAAIWLVPLTIDRIGLFFFAAAVTLTGPGAFVMAAAAILTHFQLLPFLPFVVRTWTRPALATLVLVAVPSLAALALTPYSGILHQLASPQTLLGAFAALTAGAVFLAPTLWLYRTRQALAAYAIGAVECGLQHHVQLRYFAPALVLTCLRSPALTQTRSSARMHLAAMPGIPPRIERPILEARHGSRRIAQVSLGSVVRIGRSTLRHGAGALREGGVTNSRPSLINETEGS